jgi:hypothetical protein
VNRVIATPLPLREDRAFDHTALRFANRFYVGNRCVSGSKRHEIQSSVIPLWHYILKIY